MAHYRLLLFDRAGLLTHRQELTCEDDARAIEEAERHTAVNAVEVWRGDTLVRRLAVRPRPDGG